MAEAPKSPRFGLRSPAPLDLNMIRESSGRLSMSSPRRERSLKVLTAQSPKYMKELDKKYKEMNYFEVVAAMRVQVPPKQHIHLLKAYPNTMLASDIVKWLTSSNHASTVAEAEYLGSALIGHGHIYNVLDEDTDMFANGNQLYKYSKDDRMEFNVESVDFDQVETLLARSTKKREVVANDVTQTGVLAGSDMVDLIVQKGMVTGRSDAVRICEKLLTNRVIYELHENDKNIKAFDDDSQTLYFLRDQNRQGSRIKPETLDLDVESGRVGSRQYSSLVSAGRGREGREGREDAEVGSLRNLFAPLSPRNKQSREPLASPLSKMKSRNDLLSPRENGLSKPQHAHVQIVQPSRTQQVHVDVVDEAEIIDDDDLAKAFESTRKSLHIDRSLTRDHSSRASFSMKGLNFQDASSQKSLEEKYKGTSFVNLSDTLQTQLPSKQHTHQSKAYPNTLSGGEIMDWLVTSGCAASSAEAAYLGAELLSRGHIFAVLDEEDEFQKDSLYRYIARKKTGGLTPLSTRSREERCDSRKSGIRDSEVSSMRDTSKPGIRDSEVSSMRNLVSILSPRKQTGNAVTSPLAKAKSRKDVLSPRESNLSSPTTETFQ